MRHFLWVRKSLRSKQDGLSDIVRVTFRHRDPLTATEFANAVVTVFTHSYFGLYKNSDAVAFFLDEQKKSRLALDRASAAFAEFASANSLYRIEEQLRLLIEERSRQASDLSKTKGLIATKESEASAIPLQLSQMKPIGRLPQITTLTRLPGKPTGHPAEKHTTIDQLGSDPPLLLVRVYQDTIATLVRLQTDLAGLRALKIRARKRVPGDLTKYSAPSLPKKRSSIDFAGILCR